jgi:hypothetical protein
LNELACLHRKKAGVGRNRALRRAAIALSGRILSNVCSVALLVNIGIARSLRSFPLSRILGFKVLFSLCAGLGFWRLLSVFMTGTGFAMCIRVFLR